MPVWPFVCSFPLERQSGRGCFMKTQSRFRFLLGYHAHAFIPPPLPIDTQAKRGIYSPHIEFCPFRPGVAGLAHAAKGTDRFRRERLVRSRSLKQPQLCLKPVWRSHVPGSTGPVAFPVQNGRSKFDFYQAWESGSPLPSSKRNSPPRPDLPGFQREQGSAEQLQYDFSDIPCFKVLRHGKDFNAIRRGQ